MIESMLLAEYAKDRSPEAFGRLVEQYVDLVYASARRQLQDAHLADDVTQAVFILLSQKAGDIPTDRPLSAWLLTTTRYVVANTRRGALCRKNHERRAAAMKNEATPHPDDSATWDDVSPLLDEGLARLGESDRDVLLLRFFESKTLRQTGDALGISEDAAEKRISRAIDRLRDFLSRRGVGIASASLVVGLSQSLFLKTPQGLASTIVQGGQAVSANTLKLLATQTKVMIMTAKSIKITACVAAAILAIIVPVGVMAWKPASPAPASPSPASPAYALDQTRAANHDVRSIHLKCEPAGKGIGDLWVQFDENGTLTHYRMSFPDTEDGPKEVVGQEGKATVWFRAKNHYLIVKDDEAKNVRVIADSMDPRLVMEDLDRRQAAGTVRIETQEPSAPGESIILTATSTASPDSTTVYHVDPNTNLLTQLERNGKIIKYLDYNQPIDPAVFQLTPAADSMLIDQTAQAIGLAQEKLSDRDVAVQVVRKFFEAVIAKDYAEAGRLYEGIPAATLREGFGKIKVLRIVSIGEPTPSPKNGGKAVHVPCRIELENNGAKSIEEFNPGVRTVYNHPDRWDIFGGI